jgi:hypothetical protein
VPQTFSYRFTEIRKGVGRAWRPLLSVVLAGPKGRSEVQMLVDSGADTSMVPLGVAQAIGLELTAVDQASGVTGGFPVFRATVLTEIKHGEKRLPPLVLPALVPTEPGIPAMSVLGREVFFSEFDISFRMGLRPTEGKFVLSPTRR